MYPHHVVVGGACVLWRWGSYNNKRMKKQKRILFYFIYLALSINSSGTFIPYTMMLATSVHFTLPLIIIMQYLNPHRHQDYFLFYNNNNNIIFI